MFRRFIAGDLFANGLRVGLLAQIYLLFERPLYFANLAGNSSRTKEVLQ